MAVGRQGEAGFAAPRVKCLPGGMLGRDVADSLFYSDPMPIPQFLQKREFNFNQAVIGMRQILWGLAKKILVADTCAYYVDRIYDAPDYFAGPSILLVSILFMFQIYAD